MSLHRINPFLPYARTDSEEDVGILGRWLQRARAKLEAKKVRFDGPTQVIEGMVKLATFYDADRNKLMLYQDILKKILPLRDGAAGPLIVVARILSD